MFPPIIGASDTRGTHAETVTLKFIFGECIVLTFFRLESYVLTPSDSSVQMFFGIRSFFYLLPRSVLNLRLLLKKTKTKIW
jgi:hypothetical protein